MDILYMVREFKENHGLRVHEKTYPFINVESAIQFHKKMEKQNEFKINTSHDILVEYED